MHYQPRSRPGDRRPPTCPQILGILKRLLAASPNETLPDLIEALKCALLKQGYAYPPQERLTQALLQLEQEYRRKHRALPALHLRAPPPRLIPEVAQQVDPPWSGRRQPSAKWTSLRDLATQLTARNKGRSDRST